MATCMKFDEKSRKITEKSQRRMDRVAIILGLALLVASCFSYFVVEAFAQSDLVKFDCQKGAYYGLDNQGNEACRDIITNQILEPESAIIIDSDSEKTKSDSWLTIPETDEITLNDEQIAIVGIITLALIGIIASIFGVRSKKIKLEIFQRRGLSNIQKEQVRNRQYDKCNMCFTSPSQWKYDYFDGDKSNNDINNCQGLCPDCFSIKTERNNRPNIYQKLK